MPAPNLLRLVGSSLALVWVAAALLGCGQDAIDESASSTAQSLTNSETGAPSTCASVDGCPEGQWCDFSDDKCGGELSGTCTPRPEDCDDDTVRVCGCDGEVYVAGCEQASGVDKSQRVNDCPIPDGYFACGDELCDASASYCRDVTFDADGESQSYKSCEPLPAACGDAPNCACLGVLGCDGCEQGANGGLTLYCTAAGSE